MSFQKVLASVAIAAGILAVTGAAWAQSDGQRLAPKKQTLTITLDGTLGPIISGSDPAGLDGQSAMVTIEASESLKPPTAHFAAWYGELPGIASRPPIDDT